MSFKRGGMSNYAFGMMSQCQIKKISKGDCGRHPYPKCNICRDLGKIPPGDFCPAGCKASKELAKIIEANRKKALKHDCPSCECDK